MNTFLWIIAIGFLVYITAKFLKEYKEEIKDELRDEIEDELNSEKDYSQPEDFLYDEEENDRI